MSRLKRVLGAKEKKIEFFDEEAEEEHDEEESEEEEFYQTDDDDDDDDDDENENENDYYDEDDDDEGEEREEVDISSGWGRKKNKYYSTDYDEEKEVERDETQEQGISSEEEEEAQRLQKIHLSTLQQDDFFLLSSLAPTNDSLKKKLKDTKKDKSLLKTQPTDKEGEETVERELTKDQKLKVLKVESPELLKIIESAQHLVQKLRFIVPFLDEFSQKLSSLPKDTLLSLKIKGFTFLKIKQQILLRQLSSLLFYFVTKVLSVPIQEHTVLPSYFEFSSLLGKYQKEFDILDQEIEDFIENEENNDEMEEKGIKKKKPNKNEKSPKQKQFKKDNFISFTEGMGDFGNQGINISKNLKRKRELLEKEIIIPGTGNDGSVGKKDVEQKPLYRGPQLVKEGERRKISYEIMKNKGLTPKRRKIDRNPRLKQRAKYEKAIKRRKGQVRSMLSQQRPYQGELTGINPNITRSISLKSK